MASSSPATGKAGVIKAQSDATTLDTLAHSVLDDLLYNIVHDALLKVHRDEKMARASTAAIQVEKLAAEQMDGTMPDSRPELVETNAARYADGKVTLKGNPLQTTQDIICPRCQLPRLLYPTDGKGARKPDPSVIYCKKLPYIDKTGYDIYGQTWIAQGPGRGKKKKDMEKKAEHDTPPGATPTPDDAPTEGSGKPGKGGAASRPPNVLSFPSATCSKCKRCILVTRLNNHMGSCIGNSGRNASRAAAQKISNGNGNGNGNSNGSQGERTPPSSQKGTPVPASRATSPKKRDGEDLEDDDDTDNSTAPKKKKAKTVTSSANPTKKVILKTKGSGTPGLKKEKVKTSSSLSVEQKVDDAESLLVEVAPKKKMTKVPSPAKKLKLDTAKSSQHLAPSNGKPAKTSGGTTGGGRDNDSESSGTLSSPPLV